MKVLEGRENDQPDITVPDAPRKAAVSENMEESPRDLPEDEKRERREAAAESRQKADGVEEAHKFEAPRDELARFNPERAGLRAISDEAAAEYVAEHRAARPWIAMVEKACPEARRILVAMDSGDGHGHIRHEGWVTEEALRRRAAYLEDPAQLDAEKRILSIDGLKPGDKRHACGEIATRITDPDVFVTAFARGVSHPRVREALEMPFDPDNGPDAITVPISDLLGPDGHQYCTGWRLELVDDDMDKARDNRKAWVKAKAEGSVPDVPEPRVAPLRSFEGGVITFLPVANEAEGRYEILTMYIDPPDDDPEGVT
jgi:hypothetical protein